MDFTIEDVPFDPSGQLPAAVERALRVIENLPDGKLLLGASLAKRADITYHSWSQYGNHPAFRDLKIIALVDGTRKNLYGKAATIEAYKEQVAGNG